MPRFRNVAPALGLDTFDLAGGGIVEDLDNDGWLDILTSTMDPWGSLTLLHNEGDGTFINNTVAAGLDVQWGGLSMSAADYDNDGDVDVLVLRGGLAAGTGPGAQLSSAQQRRRDIQRCDPGRRRGATGTADPGGGMGRL